MNDAHQLTNPRTSESPRYTSSPFEPELPPVEQVGDIDLTDPDLLRRGDPHAAWALLRREAPVYWHEKGFHGTRDRGFWAVTTYDEVSHVHRHAEVFSSTETTFPDFLPEEFPLMLSTMDAPQHAKYRRLPARFFTQSTVDHWAGDMDAIVTSLLDRAADKRDVDFVSDISNPLPVLATGQFFGIAPDAVAALAARLQSVDISEPAAMVEYTAAVQNFFAELTQDPAAWPKDTIIGSILHGEIDGEPLDRTEALIYLWILFTGALDTTAHAAASGLLSLFHHPDQFRRLQNDPSLVPSAVDEMLRWVAPSNVEKRYVLSDTELGGQKIKAGDYVTTWLASANRDERAFPDPFHFDVGRQNKNAHLTFGLGPHLCLGIHVAKLELRALFRQLLERFTRIEQTDSPERGKAFTIIMSPVRRLPVRLS